MSPDRPLGPWLLCFALIACGREEPSDAVTYSAVLADRDRPPDEALAACRTLVDPALQGDCALVAASRSEQPGVHCPQVPLGVWQEECWFIAAEAVNRLGEAEQAATLCQRAGRFRLDCAQHLWQTPVHQLIHSRGAAGFLEALPEAAALHDAWAPVLAAQSDFESRFWAKFFGNGFEGQGLPITTRWCIPLPRTHQAACRNAAAAFLARELGPAVEQPARLMAFCRLPAPGVEAVRLWLDAEPDPLLDQVVAERQVDICTNAPGAPGRVGP